MQFEWDDEKSRSNLKKHRVSFERATLVFEDMYAVTVPDECETEDRWLTMGLVNATVVLVVVHTLKEENNGKIIRIVSARKATKAERETYEEAAGNIR